MIERFTASTSTSPIMICFSLSVVDDDRGEPLEHFAVFIEPHNPRERLTVRNGRINVTIRDNECELNETCVYYSNSYTKAGKELSLADCLL